MECRPWPVRRSIPLLIGGTSEAAIRRAARLGDGFFPYVSPNEDVRQVLPQVLSRLREETEAAGRDPDALELTAGGARTSDEALWFAELGIHRLTIAVRSRTVPEMKDELRRFADDTIAKTAEW